MRPLRFAIQAAGAADGPSWRALARKVEDLGYSALYVPDHLDEQWAPLVALTVAAEATTRLRVGPLVLDNDYRHPVVLAKELATLDLVSGGRLEAGLGAGWRRSDYDQAGLPFDSPGARVDRLAEAIRILKDLWATGTSTRSGAHYRVTQAVGHPRPHSSPHPRLLIGGGGRRVLSLAAREADIVGVNASLAPGQISEEVAASALADRFAARIGWIRDAAGRRFGQLELQILAYVAQIVPNATELLAAMAPAYGISPQQAADSPMVVLGSVEEVCEVIQARRERFGLSCWVFHQDAIDGMAPVVARLAGT